MFFSKALFKQSMKAHWVKWLMVTLSTCIMLAIIIVVLGNLGINNIRDSLKEVFVQADQESFLKENAVDGTESARGRRISGAQNVCRDSSARGIPAYRTRTYADSADKQTDRLGRRQHGRHHGGQKQIFNA